MHGSGNCSGAILIVRFRRCSVKNMYIGACRRPGALRRSSNQTLQHEPRLTTTSLSPLPPIARAAPRTHKLRLFPRATRESDGRTRSRQFSPTTTAREDPPLAPLSALRAATYRPRASPDRLGTFMRVACTAELIALGNPKRNQQFQRCPEAPLGSGRPDRLFHPPRL